ncbi:MAG: LLM class flavin-dependent oxidoreductase [Promethearchaeota archaeon]|uniref:Luciferase-like domain-containing protein n=1 Tax=marine sediment metagenome TaxID=412755 RepID=X1AGS2_9ZZZZ
MKFGFVFPRADVYKAIEFAKVAEDAGWDAFFFWEPTYGIDAWVTLAAIARETNKIRLGTLLSPISRMRPWKIASDVLTLDILSNGRVTLCVGLGAIDTGFEELGEEIDRKTRAELLDEGLEIMNGLWKWDLSNYDGKHYKINNLKDCEFFNRHPPPKLIQSPRVPIWVVGAWPAKKSMDRTMKYDGIIPTIKRKQGEFEKITPDHVREISAYVEGIRPSSTPFDIIIEGITPGDNTEAALSIVRPFAEAGATWWIESDWVNPNLDSILERVKLGPPK